MGKGILKIELFTGENVLPVAGMSIIIWDYKGNVVHRLQSDENGLAGPVELEAPTIDSNASDESVRECSFYDVEIPKSGGFQGVIRRGVHIYDGQTTMLPVRMHPFVPGMEEVDEITIPTEHGADMGEPRFQNEDLTALQANLERAIKDNNIVIPTHITVHLGQPKTRGQKLENSGFSDL